MTVTEAEVAERLAAAYVALEVVFYARECTTDNVRMALQSAAEGRGISLREICEAVRAAVTGQIQGLPLFESVVALGPERTLRRIRELAELLEPRECACRSS